MKNLKLSSVLIIFSCIIAFNLSAQSLEVDGDAKITMLATDNTADKVVVQQIDGTLAVRDAATLGGSLTGIEKITAMTTAETVPDNGYHSQVPVATCPSGKFLIGGFCDDSAGSLVEWGIGGSGSNGQFVNANVGRAYACRSRNTSGGALNNLVITATAICATTP